MPPSPLVLVHTRDSDTGSPAPTPIDLGARLRELRMERGWSLEEASDHIGLSRSALFKVEKGRMSPTFDAMRKIAAGYGLDVAQLLVPASEHRATGRRSVSRRGQSAAYESEHYVQTPLASDLAHKPFLPFELVLKARSLDEFEDWDRHETEDFMYVLSGVMVLYTEFYEPLTLRAGDSVHYDSRMGHACVSVGDEDARVLWVNSG